MSNIHSKRTLSCLPTDNPYLLDNWLPTDTFSAIKKDTL